jgi:hypothetical protein
MKTAFLSMLMALTLSAQAMAGSANSLKNTFDEFNYAVTVEWDQKDSAFYDQQVKLLESNLMALQEAGLENEELITLGLSQVKDSNLQEEANEILQHISNDEISEVEARDLLLSFQDKNYSQGANWSGNTVITAGVAVVVVIGVVLVASRVYKSKANVKNN